MVVSNWTVDVLIMPPGTVYLAIFILPEPIIFPFTFAFIPWNLFNGMVHSAAVNCTSHSILIPKVFIMATAAVLSFSLVVSSFHQMTVDLTFRRTIITSRNEIKWELTFAFISFMIISLCIFDAAAIDFATETISIPVKALTTITGIFSIRSTCILDQWTIQFAASTLIIPAEWMLTQTFLVVYVCCCMANCTTVQNTGSDLMNPHIPV